MRANTLLIAGALTLSIAISAWAIVLFRNTWAPAKSAVHSLDFDDHTWVVADNQTDFQGLWLAVWLPADIIFYKTDDPSLRLVGISKATQDGGNQRKTALIVQKKIAGTWKEHGKYYVDYWDGMYGFTTHFNGELHGPQEEYFPDGKLRIRRAYLNGKNNGRDEGWHKDGSKEWDSNYVNGKLNGLSTTFHEDGSIWSEATYVNGKEIESKIWKPGAKTEQ
jgi:hypothetical protein